jgi:drug/metabolite transporter (DMT)-like permease
MDALSVTLMLLAGLLHASWHALVKATSSLATLAGMGVASAIVTLPLLMFVDAPPAPVWPVLILSLVLHGCYKLSLSLAYQRGDLSTAYPLARGFVPLCALPLSYVVFEQTPQLSQIFGIVTVSMGVVGLAAERTRLPPNVALTGAALSAGLMVAAYSVVDAYGVRSAGWASFTAWLIVLDSLSFLCVARLVRGELIWRELMGNLTATIAAGLLGVSAFAIFMWALSRGAVAAVVAFRECSVLFAAIIGWLFLRDRPTVWRVISTLLIAAGLATIAASR